MAGLIVLGIVLFVVVLVVAHVYAWAFDDCDAGLKFTSAAVGIVATVGLCIVWGNVGARIADDSEEVAELTCRLEVHEVKPVLPFELEPGSVPRMVQTIRQEYVFVNGEMVNEPRIEVEFNIEFDWTKAYTMRGKTVAPIKANVSLAECPELLEAVNSMPESLAEFRGTKVYLPFEEVVDDRDHLRLVEFRHDETANESGQLVELKPDRVSLEAVEPSGELLKE